MLCQMLLSCYSHLGKEILFSVQNDVCCGKRGNTFRCGYAVVQLLYPSEYCSEGLSTTSKNTSGYHSVVVCNLGEEFFLANRSGLIYVTVGRFSKADGRFFFELQMRANRKQKSFPCPDGECLCLSL